MPLLSGILLFRRAETIPDVKEAGSVNEITYIREENQHAYETKVVMGYLLQSSYGSPEFPVTTERMCYGL